MLRKSPKRKCIHTKASTRPSRDAQSLHRVEAQHTTLEKSIMCFFSQSSKNRTHIWDKPHFMRLIESHQVSSDCILIAYDCTAMHTNELVKAVAQALPQEVSCPGLEKTILKTHITQLSEILLTNDYFTFWQQTLPQNYQSLQGRDPITRNMWHEAISNPGTAVRKLTTQE